MDKLAAHKRYRFIRINGTAPPYTCIVLPLFIPVVMRRVSVDNSIQVHWNLNPARHSNVPAASLHISCQHCLNAGWNWRTIDYREGP